MTILERIGAIPLPMYSPNDPAADPAPDPAQDPAADPAPDPANVDPAGDPDPKPAKPGTAIDNENDDPAAHPADWPDDWKEKLADGDEEVAKLINRYGSPKAVAKAMLEREKLIRSGKLRRDMPDPEDEAAMKEWRKSEGVPDDPTGYVLPETIKELVTDDDKPMLENFTEFAHSKNLPQSAIEPAIEWYFQQQDAAATQQAEADKEAAETAISELRSEYGAEYKSSMQLAKRFMESTPEIGDEWREARLPNGQRLGDIPGFVRFAVEQGRAMFGDSAFATPDAEAAHSNRLAEIEQIMKTDIARYHKEGLSKEYEELLQREEKRKK